LKKETAHLVIGGAGFIGSRLVDKLLLLSQEVYVVDSNPSSFLSDESRILRKSSRFTQICGDINQETQQRNLRDLLENKSIKIWHLAANSDIKSGSDDPRPDTSNSLSTTSSAVVLLDFLNVESVFFSSTSAVYGEMDEKAKPFNEVSRCEPISYYGILKFASEKLLQLACRRKDIPLLIFRFANIVGSPATHGLLFDVIKKIEKNDSTIQILGNGKQLKSYFYVEDLIDAMIEGSEIALQGIFNIGYQDNGMTVIEIIDAIASHANYTVNFEYGNEVRGWNGDAKLVLMNCEKLQRFVQIKKRNSREAVHIAIHEVMAQFGIEVFCDKI
jgi:UDP-glucose 4-epimerase